jgi:hypothetical protein
MSEEKPEGSIEQRVSSGRIAGGRFARGNTVGAAGRPPGSRHKATLAVEALLEGEAEGLTRKAIELALGGDTTAVRLCLERLAPPVRSRRVNIDLPKLEVPQDLVTALAKVIEAMGGGEKSPRMRPPWLRGCWRPSGRQSRRLNWSAGWRRWSRGV